MSTPAPRKIGGIVLTLFGLTTAVPSHAAAGITIEEMDTDGSVLHVTGQATFADAPFVSMGSDPAADQLPPGGNAVGKDVTSFSVAASPNGNLTFRWHLSQLPAGLNRGVDVSYGKAFCVSPASDLNCWAVTFIDVAGTPPTNSFVWSWRCEDESCAISAGDSVHSWETDSYDAATKTANATVPMSDLEIPPGAELVPARSPNFQGSSVWVTTPWWFNFTSGTYPTYDATAIEGTYRVPEKSVSLALGAPGQAPDQVEYTSAGSLTGSRYAADLDISSVPAGDHTLYARACFGDGNCAYATRSLTL